MSDDPNDWQTYYGSVVRREKVTTHDTSGDVLCPNCGHAFEQHTVDSGCYVGWAEYHQYDRKAPAGCDCPLSLALEHNPKRDKDMP